jgi:hypothetical protein
MISARRLWFMAVLRFSLKCAMGIIYALCAAMFLYFPFAELLNYLGRETRLFAPSSMFPIEDALLPLLCLAIVYAAIAAIARRIEPSTIDGHATGSPESD